MRLSEHVGLREVRNPTVYGENTHTPLLLSLPYDPTKNYYHVQFHRVSPTITRHDDRFRHDWLLVTDRKLPRVIIADHYVRKDEHEIQKELDALTADAFFGTSSLGTLYRIIDLVEGEVKPETLTEPRLYVTRNGKITDGRKVQKVWLSNPNIRHTKTPQRVGVDMDVLEPVLRELRRADYLYRKEVTFRPVRLNRRDNTACFGILTFQRRDNASAPSPESPYGKVRILETKRDLALYAVKNSITREGLAYLERDAERVTTHDLMDLLGEPITKGELKSKEVYASFDVDGKLVRIFCYYPR